MLQKKNKNKITNANSIHKFSCRRTAADKIVPSRVSVGLLDKQIKSMLGFFNHFS